MVVRKSKLWNALAGSASLAILYAIFYPVYAYSGPGTGPNEVAHAIDQAHTATGRWPTQFEEMEPYLGRRDKGREFKITFLPIETKKDSADYVVMVNGNMRRFQTTQGRLHLVPGEVAKGVLPAR